MRKWQDRTPFFLIYSPAKASLIWFLLKTEEIKVSQFLSTPAQRTLSRRLLASETYPFGEICVGIHLGDQISRKKDFRCQHAAEGAEGGDEGVGEGSTGAKARKFHLRWHVDREISSRVA